jgi:hypothetical protein
VAQGGAGITFEHFGHGRILISIRNEARHECRSLESDAKKTRRRRGHHSKGRRVDANEGREVMSVM